MVIIYDEPVIEILDDDEVILPNLESLKKRQEKKKGPLLRCVIPGCKNIGYNIHTFCRKHSKIYKLEKPEECPICMDSLENEKYPLRADDESKSCGHWVHHSCVISSGKQECPMCREKIKLNKDQQKQLNAVKNKHKKEREEEERREIQEALRVERTIMSRNTRWFDNRRQRDILTSSRSRDVARRVQQYMESDERFATITHLQDLMTSTSTTTRNDATLLFEVQSFFNRINELTSDGTRPLEISRGLHDLVYRSMGAFELRIRHIVSDNLE